FPLRLSCICICLLSRLVVYFFLFFFQAEDGIRDATVTGVQTCALPISCSLLVARPRLLDQRLRRRSSRLRARGGSSTLDFSADPGRVGHRRGRCHTSAASTVPLPKLFCNFRSPSRRSSGLTLDLVVVLRRARPHGLCRSACRICQSLVVFQFASTSSMACRATPQSCANTLPLCSGSRSGEAFKAFSSAMTMLNTSVAFLTVSMA